MVFNLLQYKFGPKKMELYFDVEHSRAKDFSVLIQNLKDHRSDFDADVHGQIDKFLALVPSFKTDANAKAHNVMEYLESIAQPRKFKIPEMTGILLELISRVRS